MKRPIVVAAVLAFGVLAPVTIALADPNLPDVTPHRHFVVTPSGDRVEVGPRVCDNPSLTNAANQFHHNAHRSNGSTNGPQGGAPGLHNGQGSEIIAGPC